MFNRPLFIFAHSLGDRSFYTTYKQLVKNQYRPYSELKAEQEKQLRHMISYAYDNIPYYKKLFKRLKLDPGDIKRIEDLEKLPILTKEIIKKNWEDFKPINLSSMKYGERSTGGSTGTPFQYRLSKHDRFLGGALLYRGWGYAGYELGDKMVFLSGSSLGGKTKSLIIKKSHEFVRNIRKLSSFDMSIKEMNKYVKIINNFKPKYLRGYASSIYFYSYRSQHTLLPIRQLGG